jgi:COP9 signalosome complex subunit 4
MLEDVSTIISRPTLKEFALQVSILEDDDLHKRIALRALEIIQPRVVGFEEQVHIIRDKLSNLYIKDHDFLEAAKVLRGIPIDSSQRVLSDEEKATLYVKIAQLYLEEDERVEAEQFINKASLINIRDKMLSLKYKSSFARILDFKKKFLEASLQYYQLSHLVPEKEREEVLEAGVICAILAQAGPQRSRILSTLYKDERTSRLQVYGILEKMFMERIIKNEEKEKFNEILSPHQKEKIGDRSLLDRAIIEHNLLASSKVYNNIRFEDLGNLLNISPDQAERVAAIMITEDRLQGSIDQIKGLIHFRSQNSSDLQLWDGHIETLCSSVNAIIDIVSERYQQFSKSFQY